MRREVYFAVSGPGYEAAKDGFGFRGVRLVTTPGKSATVRVTRTNIAERLYRVTGQGIHRDAELLGLRRASAPRRGRRRARLGAGRAVSRPDLLAVGRHEPAELPARQLPDLRRHVAAARQGLRPLRRRAADLLRRSEDRPVAPHGPAEGAGGRLAVRPRLAAGRQGQARARRPLHPAQEPRRDRRTRPRPLRRRGRGLREGRHARPEGRPGGTRAATPSATANTSTSPPRWPTPASRRPGPTCSTPRSTRRSPSTPPRASTPGNAPPRPRRRPTRRDSSARAR